MLGITAMGCLLVAHGQSKPLTMYLLDFVPRLDRLHYHLSTNLSLLQANLTYMHAKHGTSYHWIPELHRRMNLPVFHGIVEALEKHSVHRKRKFEWAKGTPQKKRRIELKKKCVIDGQERSKNMATTTVTIAKIAILT